MRSRGARPNEVGLWVSRPLCAAPGPNKAVGVPDGWYKGPFICHLHVAQQPGHIQGSGYSGGVARRPATYKAVGVPAVLCSARSHTRLLVHQTGWISVTTSESDHVYTAQQPGRMWQWILRWSRAAPGHIQGSGCPGCSAQCPVPSRPWVLQTDCNPLSDHEGNQPSPRSHTAAAAVSHGTAGTSVGLGDRMSLGLLLGDRGRDGRATPEDSD